MRQNEEMVERIRSRFRECGSIAFWGRLLVRPYDSCFTLAEVRALGLTDLLLVLRHDDGTLHELEVQEPKGLTVADKTTLTVAEATSLRFGAGGQRLSRAGSEPALELS